MTTDSIPAVKSTAAEPAAMQAPQSGGNSNQGGRTVQVLEFLLGKEHFAIDLFDVREVVEYTPITKLPNTAT